MELFWNFSKCSYCSNAGNSSVLSRISISTDLTLLRGSIYRHKNETRQQRVARYLSNRIDNHTVAEDVQLTIWSNESMNSKSLRFIYLILNTGKSHHDHMRKQIPILKIEKQPDEHLIYKLNKEMLENILK